MSVLVLNACHMTMNQDKQPIDVSQESAAAVPEDIDHLVRKFIDGPDFKQLEATKKKRRATRLRNQRDNSPVEDE